MLYIASPKVIRPQGQTQPTIGELVMTADVSLEQFVHLKQPASDYLSQAYEISYQLNDLISAFKELPLLIQKYTRSSHTLLDRGQIPVKDLEDLNICQIQVIKYLRLAAIKDIEAFKGFAIYSKAFEVLEKKEVTHA